MMENLYLSIILDVTRPISLFHKHFMDQPLLCTPAYKTTLKAGKSLTVTAA